MDDMITVAEAADMLRVSVKTLQRWDREKKLVANRTATKRRWYTREQIARFRGEAAPEKQPEVAPPSPVAQNSAVPPAAAPPPRSQAKPAPRIITDPSDPEYVPSGDEFTEEELK